MKTLTVKLPDELARQIDQAARQRGCTRSALIRQALTGYLVEGQTSGHGPSALDLAGDLVGCVDGPEDLSSNPDHLADYGR